MIWVDWQCQGFENFSTGNSSLAAPLTIHLLVSCINVTVWQLFLSYLGGFFLLFVTLPSLVKKLILYFGIVQRWCGEVDFSHKMTGGRQARTLQVATGLPFLGFFGTHFTEFWILEPSDKVNCATMYFNPKPGSMLIFHQCTMAQAMKLRKLRFAKSAQK